MFRTFCFLAVTSAANPFIPGITLSTVLAEAAKQANEGERRTLIDVRAGIDELLLEIFERLPQTVRGFEGGLNGCTYVFDPKPMRGNDGLGGPLNMILSDPQQLKTFCKVPLVMDFLSSKFMLGLPDLNDTQGVLRSNDQLTYLRRMHTDGKPNGLVLGDAVGARLQAAEAEDLSMTFFPGAQFIVAGVVASPANYYQVPAMRMALDFIVYIATVAALSYFVYFHTAAGSMLEDDLIVDRDFSFSEGACALTFVAVRNLLASSFGFVLFGLPNPGAMMLVPCVYHPGHYASRWCCAMGSRYGLVGRRRGYNQSESLLGRLNLMSFCRYSSLNVFHFRLECVGRGARWRETSAGTSKTNGTFWTF